VLLAKLEVFEDELSRRQEIAARYSSGLKDVAAVPHVADGAVSAWAQYTLMLEAGRRDHVTATLRDAGIPTGVYYPQPLHRQTAYREFHDGAFDLSVSERLAGQVMSLPMHGYLEESLQDRIIAAVRASL
jgi:dTDP-4-amino-4,6-dideoxygalactose transaminase